MARKKDRTRQECRTAASIVGSGSFMKGSEHVEAAAPVFRTATYARLSVAGELTESDSISSQQMLMRSYIQGREEFFLVKEYQDDGVSGTRFDRRAFDCLLGEVRKGNINCIIVKDFSRFGRDHIEVGNYLEKIFPFLGVRFISINDGYDSFDRGGADKKLAVILKNLVNEYVAKDTSLKVASSYMTKQENGEYDGGRVPYGFVFADRRKTKFVVDEKPARVVRDIFAWTIQGDSAPVIVKRLTAGKINPPKVYQDTGEFYRQEKGRCYWNEFTVNAILQNVSYAGHMALHKWKVSKADGIRRHKLDKSEWKITRGTHEAVVPEEEFRLVQEILRLRKERYKSRCAMDEGTVRPENLLKGKVFCGDCRKPASRMGTNYQRKDGKVRIYRYRCRTYREKGAQECTSKSIGERELEGIVYQAVMTLIHQIGQLDSVISGFHGEFFKKMEGRIEKEKRIAEAGICQGKKEKILLYQEYSGKEHSDSDKEWYLEKKREKEEEIRSHEKRKIELEEKMAFLERMEKEQKEWMRKALAYKDTSFPKTEGRLTAQMVSLFVDKIFLYDGRKVEIVMNFKDEYENLYSGMGKIFGKESAIYA